MQNMDENSCLIYMVGNSKMIFLKYLEQAFINQVGNYEWTSLIEASATIGQ